MNPPQTYSNEVILAAILETLQRLEENLNSHGNHPDAAKREAAILSVPPDVHVRSGYHVHPSDLMRSLANLHRRFEFDDDDDDDNDNHGPEPGIHPSQGLDSKTDPVECYSVSIYPSRPLSRLDMEIAPEAAVDVDHSSTPPSLRYEDMPVPPPKSTLRELRTASSGRHSDEHDSQTRTPRSSMSGNASEKWSARASKAFGVTRSMSVKKLSMTRMRMRVKGLDMKSNNSMTNTDSDSDSSSVDSGNASGSGSAGRRLSVAVVSDAMSTVAGQASEKVKNSATVVSTAFSSAAAQASAQMKLSATATGEWVRTQAKVCLDIVPRMVSSAARATINQQFKMLDVVA